MSDASSEREERFNDVVAAYLEAVEAGQPHDRRRLQERHPDLAAEIAAFFTEQEALSSLAAPLRSLVSDGPSRPVVFSEPGALPADLDVGDYRLVREIGRGGMGIVYEAEQKSLERRVALKVLPWAATLDRQQLQRFQHEAQAAAQLHHTHIVPVFQVGCAGNVHFYAMQLIDGQSLAALLRDRRRLCGQSKAAANRTAPATTSSLRPATADGSATTPADGSAPYAEENARPIGGPVTTVASLPTLDAPSYYRQVATLGVQAAEALEYAHRRGVIHRDIKPANLLLDVSGHLWVSDFGLAKSGGSSDLTRTGDIVGTLRYLAPERFGGQAGPLSDVYSLGLTLYEMLTLHAAFAETDHERLLGQVLRTEPPPPRQRDPRIPRDLETVVLKAMAKEPGRRYATALELAEDLGRFLAGAPIRARPVGAGERLGRWCRRNPLVATLVSMLGVALLAGTGIASYFAVRASTKAVEAEAHAEKARNEKRRSDHRAYVAEINLMHQAWREGQTGLVLQRLDELKPREADDPDFRGFEWHYLQRLCRLDLRTLEGHTAPVAGVAFSPDGRSLASASEDHTVRLWDAVTGQQTAVLLGHAGKVWAVAFSPDGRGLASAADDRTVKLWDPATGRELSSLSGHGGPVHGVAFSPDGRQLASASWDKTVKLWDADTRRVVATFEGHDGAAACVAFSPRGGRLASGGHDRTVRIWDLATGREVLTLNDHENYVSGVAFSPDGRRLATASWDQTIKIWDADSGSKQLTLRGHTNAVAGVAFSSDGRRLASAGWDNTVKVWDAATGQERLTLRGHRLTAAGVAFSPDGRLLASAADDQTVKIWDAALDPETLTLQNGTADSWAVAISPDGERLASASADATIQVWKTATGEKVLCLRGHTGDVTSVAFSPDGGRLASASHDGTLKIWDLATGREAFACRGHTGFVRGVAFSPDGRRLASAGDDRTVKLWDAATGDELRILTGHTGTVSGVAFSPDGRLLASASWDKLVKLWDAATGRELHSLRGHRMYVHGVAFSPDGARLASAGWDKTVRLWDVGTGQEVLSLRGHTSNVYGVAFSPDGRRLATASDDHTVKLWEADTGHLLLNLRGHDGGVTSVAFSPDGRRLASTSRDRTVKVWEATELTPEDLCQREARGAVHFYAAQALPADAIRSRLRADPTLSEAARQRALALVGSTP